MFANAPERNNSLVISTHSPYVLSSIARLIYGGSVKNKLKEEKLEDLYKIIEQYALIDPKEFACYNISNGELVNLVSYSEDGIAFIDMDVLDKTSERIGNDIDSLINLETE
ncbi:MAG: hypothetical protein DDT42_01682 [candidate division WS2 bacterium]|uniref:AAA domain-containing protein n=1 Tax=Psychracetigena formicireducens TaxID=2986056 RepID=A0A9E2BHQ8_PSYF1|nr:hypothetical protein [Candidatus Psychracetigena formicireducens]